MTTLPALSTPCTWNTFLARSTPMVLTCMWTTPSGDSLFNDHPFGTFDAGSGRRPPHHSRRFGSESATSGLPPNRRHRNASFDHLVGAGEQRLWDIETQRFSGLEV